MRFALAISLSAFIVPLATATDLEVRVRGDGGSPLADAVVWAVPENFDSSAGSPGMAVMDQRNRQFIPHVLPVRIGTAVRFPNSDNVRHQVYSFSPPKTFQLPLYIGEPTSPVIFDKPGVVALGCNIHDQMSAWIVVVDTPYFGKTSEDGIVVLEDLDDGRYHIHAWHPGMTEEHTPLGVSLEGDGTEELTLGIRTR